MARKRLYTAAAALILVVLALGGRNAAAQSTTRPAIDERAITVLGTMSQTLARASSLSFRAESAIPIASPTGQWVHVFGASRVLLRRPDRLYVETRGDLFPHNFYYDGKRVTMYAPDQNFYATEEMSGRVHDVLLRMFEKHGNYFPFADVLHFEIHTAMTHSVTSAQFVGTSTLGGVKTDHLAFAGGGLEWEIWIGAEDHLPRLLNVTFAEVTGRPHNSVAFADWQLEPADVSDSKFTFEAPADAVQIEFRNPGPSPALQSK
jgi:hypothetical protein